MRLGATREALNGLKSFARLLSAAASGSCPQFGFHGFWGVFSKPKSNAPSARRMRYGSTKSSFMFNKTCTHARASPGGLAQVCEIGFNAGHTALLFLEAAPTAHVVSFDLGDMPWAKKQAALLTRAYGAARFKAVFGSSDVTVPPYASRMPTKCDVVFSDGGKAEALRLNDLRNLRELAQPHVLILVDEVTTLACMRGEGERTRSCGDYGMAWGGTTYAYHTAAREGWLRIDSCAWPPGLQDRDGICSGRYVARGGGGGGQKEGASGSTTSKVLLLSSYLKNGPIKDTHVDGSFHFFGTLKQQVHRFTASIALANATEHAELHVIHDDASLSDTSLPGGTKLHRLKLSYRLPPIDARYSAYWELLQQLDPPADSCIFMVDLSDVELLRSPWNLCEAAPETLFIESAQCDGPRKAARRDAVHPDEREAHHAQVVRFQNTANYLQRVQNWSNYSVTSRLATFLDEGCDGDRLMYNAGIQGGMWRVFEPYLSEIIARISVHWLRHASLQHAQNFVDMLVVNEVVNERLRRRQPVATGYPVGPLNMPSRGILCGEDAHAPDARGLLARMAASGYFFAHKRRWLPHKPPVYAIPSQQQAPRQGSRARRQPLQQALPRATWEASVKSQTTWVPQKGSSPFSSGLEAAFADELRNAPPGTVATVIDVGANNGAWTNEWASVATEAAKAGKRIEQHLFEPQPMHHARLAEVALALNASFVAAAAGRRDDSAIFHIDHEGSQTASLASMVQFQAKIRSQKHKGAGRDVSVRTIDLAAYLRQTLPERTSSTDGMSFLKLDVEASEYELLPWLLMQGALCRVSHLLIEWHLNKVTPEARLAALSLRLSLQTLLAHGCLAPPRRIHHDEFAPNNQAAPVPGLRELSVRHAPWESLRTNPWTRALLQADKVYLSSRVGTGGVDRATPSVCARTRCSGTCTFENLACDTHASAASYRASLAHPIKGEEQAAFKLDGGFPTG